jgi:hypothetical protein
VLILHCFYLIKECASAFSLTDFLSFPQGNGKGNLLLYYP